MLHRVALVRTDVSEEFSSSIIRVARIDELRKFALTNNRPTLRWNTNYSVQKTNRWRHARKREPGIMGQNCYSSYLEGMTNFGQVCWSVGRELMQGCPYGKEEFYLKSPAVETRRLQAALVVAFAANVEREEALMSRLVRNSRLIYSARWRHQLFGASRSKNCVHSFAAGLMDGTEVVFVMQNS
jgi:hypothetical protein